MLNTVFIFSFKNTFTARSIIYDIIKWAFDNVKLLKYCNFVCLYLATLTSFLNPVVYNGIEISLILNANTQK